MLRRIFATVLIVLGLAIAGAGIASGTIWRADEVVTATVPQDAEAPVLVAGGNVLATVNPNVTVTVTAPESDTPLVLAMGRESDVRAWLGESPYLEVTGLSDWETLAVQSESSSEDPSESSSEDPSESSSEDPSESGSAEPTGDATDDEGEDAPADATVPNPAGSDLWIEEVTGTGELTYDWSQVDGRWMMLVATDGSQPAPSVSMTWTREVTTPLMVPGMIVGGVIFLIGLVWLIIELLMHREERRARRRGTDEAETTPEVATTAADGTPLTRRQIREAARTGKAGGTTVAAQPSSGAEAPSASTPAEASDTETPSDWTAIISGDRSEPAEPGSTADSGAAPASGASDLDDWVRSGRTGDGAGPVSTYESPAPGRGLGGAHTSSADVTWRGAETEDDTAAAASEDRPRRWWQRKAKPPAETPVAAPTDGGDPAEPGTAATADAEGASDANPQASGASWRQTWGLTPDAGPTGSSSPEPTEETDTDDRGEDEEVDR